MVAGAARGPWARNWRANDTLGIGLSLLLVLLVLAFLFVEPVQRFVGVNLTQREAQMLVAGVALGIGILILVDDRVSTPLTSRNILGLVAMMVGVYLLLGESLGPVGSAVWQAFVATLTLKHILAALVGIVFIVLPILYYRNRNQRRLP